LAWIWQSGLSGKSGGPRFLLTFLTKNGTMKVVREELQHSMGVADGEQKTGFD
jgi:hypothetical protein